jgi:hypothetical protein
MHRCLSLFRLPGTYLAHIRAFQPNARLYLLNMILTGAGLVFHRSDDNLYLQTQKWCASKPCQ